MYLGEHTLVVRERPIGEDLQDRVVSLKFLRSVDRPQRLDCWGLEKFGKDVRPWSGGCPRNEIGKNTGRRGFGCDSKVDERLQSCQSSCLSLIDSHGGAAAEMSAENHENMYT